VARAQLIITAVVMEGRSKSEVARDYGVSRYWVQQLVSRYQREGPAAFQHRSRRPHHSPHAVDADTEDAIIRLRKELSKQGLDAGAETIAAHLARQTPTGGRSGVPAVSTIWRILSRRGFVSPQPQKRPRSSWRTFCADQPNQRWQADITHWRLADGTEVGILNIIDDHSRLCLGSDARRNTTGPDVVASFGKAFAQWGIPAGVLTDNGAVFTAKQRGEGRVALEVELGVLGVKFDHSRPYHPQTCGKVERFHQTQKKWLAAQPRAATLGGLQRQLDRFAAYYNTIRPHRALQRRTPAQAFAARPKAIPTGIKIPAHYRVRNDTIDSGGTVTVRHNSRLHHIGLGAARRGTRVTLLIDNLHIRVIGRDTGQLIRELTLDPTRDYQPRGLPPGPPPGTLCRPPAAAPDPGPTAAPATGVKAGRRPPARAAALTPARTLPPSPIGDTSTPK
jgi:transposase InsO family protein